MVQKKRPPFAISVFFQLMNLCVLYSLGKTIRNKILNYKETVSSIDTNDNVAYGTGIVECDCQQHKDFVVENRVC